MKKLLLAVALLFTFAGNGLAQQRIIYDNTANGGFQNQDVKPGFGLPVQIVNPATPSTTPILVTTPATIRVTAAQTITASSAYSPGNAVGGLITFTNASRASGSGGIIQTVVIRDKAGQAGTYNLFLFDANPTATTVTDKSAVTINTADLAKVIAVIAPSGILLGAASTMGVITAGGLGTAFKLTSGTTMWGILVTRGTPTYASTSDVSVDVVILPD